MSFSDPSFQGNVPVPTIEMPPGDASTNRVSLSVVIVLASLLLLLLLLLLFLAITPPTNSEGGSGNGNGTGVGSQVGEGSGTSAHGTEDGAGAAGTELDDRLGELDDKNQTAADVGDGNQTPKPEATATDMSTEDESKKPKTAPQRDESFEAESIPEERSLGERIADNLSVAPSDSNEEGSRGGNGAGAVTVRVFGVGGYGSKFVFVFDRSGSMSGRKLLDAQKELLDSLSVLNEKHRFNIIFYDDNFTVWKPGEKLVAANVSEKKSAEEFVRSIKTQGGTSHLPPLLAAMEYKPDVIFFLTDGQSLTESELSEIARKSGKISINVIQFAENDERRSEILRQLASQNRGRYRYINVSNSDAL